MVEMLTPDLCPSFPDHGPMALRALKFQSPEQRWCGTWFDCQNPRCGSSLLIPSPELTASHEGPLGARKPRRRKEEAS